MKPEPAPGSRRDGAELDLTPSELLVLRDLLMNGQSSISDTVNRTGLAQSRVPTSVPNLRARGTDQDQPDPNDGRKTLATATRAVKLEGDRHGDRSGGDTLAPVLVDADPKERQTLTRVLERLHQLLVTPNTTTELRTLKSQRR